MNQNVSPSPSWRLKVRNDLHLARKVWHCGMGVFMALVYGLGTPKVICVFFTDDRFDLFFHGRNHAPQIPTLERVCDPGHGTDHAEKRRT